MLATYVYSLCSNATTRTTRRRRRTRTSGPTAADRPSPLWHDDLCYTSVNLPSSSRRERQDGAGEVLYRERDGRPAVFNNNSVTHLEETIEGGVAALTELQYDDWGGYGPIVYPEGETGRRYAVEYTYDDDRHADIAAVQEYDLDDDGATDSSTKGSTRRRR